MGMIQKRKYCPDCKQKMLHAKQTPSHVFHLLLTVFTAGLWLPVWVLIILLNVLEPFRCQVCGKGQLG